MSQICVVTSDARAYYWIVSRLKRAGLSFTSELPSSGPEDCGLMICTAEEVRRLGDNAVAIESLDGHAGVFKGQLLSKLNGGRDVLLAGVDPGTRIGLAVFYGEANLEYSTFGSASLLGRRVGAFVRFVRASEAIVRVGNGSPATAAKIVEVLRAEAAGARLESVDESGTSVRRVKAKGIQGDQGAAARIAFRRGTALAP